MSLRVTPVASSSLAASGPAAAAGVARTSHGLTVVLAVQAVDGVDVAGRRALRIELRCEPGVDDSLRVLDADHSRAHRDDVRVVALRGAHRRVDVVRVRGADAGNLVRRHADADPGAAAEDAAIEFLAQDCRGDA